METENEGRTAPSIAKHLASCNARTRSNAIRLLQSHLPAQPSVSEEEMKKIWKGLFYCMWHADKQQQQVDLIERLASLLRSLPFPLSLLYFSSFLITINREWPGIDHLRLDKFYLLNRRFLRHLFLLFSSHSWDPELAAQFVDVLCERSLLSLDGLPSQGVNYHIAEVFLDELKGFMPLPKVTLELLMKPFFGVLEKSSDKVLVGKIRSGLFGPLLAGGRKLLERKTEGLENEAREKVGNDETEKFGVVAVSMGFSGRFLEIASSRDTVQGNRKVLFALHEAFMKLEKDFERSAIEVSLPDVPVAAEVAKDSSEQVEPESGVNGSDGNNPEKKKTKKAKKMLNGADKKLKSRDKKKKKKKGGISDPISTETVASMEVENGGDDTAITFNETVISNLQKQFEKVAAEAGMDVGNANLCGVETMQDDNTVSKKRKRGKGVDGLVSLDKVPNGDVLVDGSATGKSSEKSAKKVKFSMKSNLVWKPHSPLPPQSLRLPPSVTPRGSALKKGIPPGPIREAALVKKVKRRKTSAVKKAIKSLKGISPAVKSRRKLHALAM